MKLWTLVKGWLKAPMFSPAGFVVRAAALALVYFLLSLAGFRNYMSVLSLTFPEGSSRAWALFAGMSYLITYFLWILGVPILLLAAALMAWVKRFCPFLAGEGQGGGSTLPVMRD